MSDQTTVQITGIEAEELYALALRFSKLSAENREDFIRFLVRVEAEAEKRRCTE